MHRSRLRAGGAPAAIVTLLLVVLASCGNGDSGGGASAVPSSAQATGQSPPASPTSTAESTITATLTDFNIDLSETSLSPGTYTLIVKQQGQTTHALSIAGPGIAQQTTPNIPVGGADQQLTVDLQPGTYEVWCPVDGHKDLGMDTTIAVQ